VRRSFHAFLHQQRDRDDLCGKMARLALRGGQHFTTSSIVDWAFTGPFDVHDDGHEAIGQLIDEYQSAMRGDKVAA
jgi:hypothetical protein